LNTISEIVERRKSGQKIRPTKSPTQRKSPKQHICHKFKGNPVRFFSSKPSTVLLKNLNIAQDILQSQENKDKFNTSSKYKNSTSKIDTGLSSFRKLNSEKNIKINENLVNSIDDNNKGKDKLKEFNINSEISKKGEKEKALNNIISNLNLEESLNASKLEKA